MNSAKNKKCCKDCKKGQAGQNSACKAKLMLYKLKGSSVTTKIKKS